ncbi:MAG: serine/threonine-protein kinase [Kofleriaceae bacterium]
MLDGAVVPLQQPARRKPATRFGEYEIVTPLARGGMGGVYLAQHETTRERVALKVLDSQFANHPEIVARLFAEQTLASRVQHPGLVDIRFTRRSSDDVPYLVMEYLEGETLGAIADREQLDVPTIVSICAQVAAALAALHDAGVIHCDVKHDNIFVMPGGRVKVIDFGVSRLVAEPPDDDAAIAGTPWCMAPEQWQGRPSTASDVYALGCMLYDLATGLPPFDGSLPELMIAHLEQRPARPSWVAQVALPMELERIILRALVKDPAQRPTMHELAADLAALADASTAVVELRRAG